jgi:DNA-binding transcriptional ArsR family regulator
MKSSPARQEEQPSFEPTEAHVEAFGALAHPSRLQIVALLARVRREMAVSEIRAALGIPAPTLSHHLDLLRRAGLLKSRRETRFVYYSVRPEMVTELARLLTACC